MQFFKASTFVILRFAQNDKKRESFVTLSEAKGLRAWIADGETPAGSPPLQNQE
jgi:hypothetical protein